MQAYKHEDLLNRFVKEECFAAFKRGLLTEDSYNKILLSHPDKLYTPNFFIRIAICILTTVAVVFAAILMGLLFATGDNLNAIIFLVLFAVMCYAALEIFISRKRFFNAGVDNVLILSVVIFIVAAFFVNDFNISFLYVAGIITLLSFYMAARFTDAFMAATSYLSFFIFVYFLFIKLGPIAKAIAPFFMMLVSALIFLLLKSVVKKERMVFYRFCIKSVTFLTLVTLYASANYFIVRECSRTMFGISGSGNIPFGWFFWTATFAIPALYLLYGIGKRDLLFIRTGIVLIAASVFTLRYYYNVLPMEIVMLIAGSVLIATAYLVTRLLNRPRFGYTFAPSHISEKSRLNLEALIIAQSFGTASKTESSNLYAGGSGGGGGAEGKF